MTKLTEAQRLERHYFLTKLALDGYTVEEAMRKYDAKFGTNYSQSLHKDKSSQTEVK